MAKGQATICKMSRSQGARPVQHLLPPHDAHAPAGVGVHAAAAPGVAGQPGQLAALRHCCFGGEECRGWGAPRAACVVQNGGRGGDRAGGSGEGLTSAHWNAGSKYTSYSRVACRTAMGYLVPCRSGGGGGSGAFPCIAAALLNALQQHFSMPLHEERKEAAPNIHTAFSSFWPSRSKIGHAAPRRQYPAVLSGPPAPPPTFG